MRVATAVLALSLLSACSERSAGVRELHVAVASNLSQIIPEIAKAFERRTGVRIVPTYGSTAQLTRQIENGAPIDVLLAADTQHVEDLVQHGHGLKESRMIYARGRLVVWAPQHKDIHSLNDLAAPAIVNIAIARPELAPYGQAAVEALRSAGLWDKLEKKVVYAPSIMAAKQLADTGNADAAFTATSLVVGQKGNSFPVGPALYSPVDQAACVTTQAHDRALAQAFMDFLAGEQMRTLFRRYGYIAG